MQPDVIVIGSGPAGVSACYPLLEAGLKVLMLDAAAQDTVQACEPQAQLPPSDYGHVSPKLRAPFLQSMLTDYARHMRIEAEGFFAVGALAPGGLTHAWGAGVARFDDADLAQWPITAQELAPSYEAVIRRIGVSGGGEHMQPSMPLDRNHKMLLDRHHAQEDFDLWPAHNATLTQPKDGRMPCTLSGECLWSCKEGAVWNAGMALEELKRHPSFSYRHGIWVEKLWREHDLWQCGAGASRFAAPRIILAAGTLATTRIVLATLGIVDRPVQLQSKPTFGFMLWLPRRFGARKEAAYTMAQLNYRYTHEGTRAYGNLFSAAMLPTKLLAEMAGPWAWLAKPLLRLLQPSAVVGNGFMPGHFSQHLLMLRRDGSLYIRGMQHHALGAAIAQVRRGLRTALQARGAWLLPFGFRMAITGADAHYGATLPMSEHPGMLQTDRFGELNGSDNLFIVDGAAFSTLPEKPPTLTIMANADRIARHIAAHRHG